MKHLLRYSLLLFFAFFCSISYAQKTVIFTAGSDKGALSDAGKAGDKITKDGITIETVNGKSAFAAAQYRFAKNSTTSFTSTVGNITKVVFTCTASGSAKYGPGCFDTPSVGSFSFTDKIGTWEGNTASFTLTASTNQVRATTIEVTYVPGQVSDKADAGLKWSKTSLSLEKGSKFTAPTFTKSTTAPVIFTSDNESVASVNSEGNITLGGSIGKATITATSSENDDYFAGSAVCTIEVYTLNVYNKTTSVESGKKYLLVAQRNDSTTYAYPLAVDKNYGYLNGSTIKELTNTIKVKNTYNNEFTITENGTGFNIQDGNGRYYYSDAKHHTFSVSDAQPTGSWTITAQGDGTFKVSYGDYYIQWGQGKFKSFGLYTEDQENAVFPLLYVFDEEATGIKGVTVDKDDANNFNAPIYNLSGQRVNKDYKGVVIQNGKKRINK